MSSEIFKWQPQMMESEDGTVHNTLVSQFETGAEQRRIRFGREIGTWRFNYDMVMMDQTCPVSRLQDAILAFYKARKGKYDNFWLPSWELEAKILSATSNTLTLRENPTDLGFSATDGDQGNYLYICNHYCVGFNSPDQEHEIKKISSITGSGPYTITIENTFINTYSANAHLQKAYKVIFGNDELKRSRNTPYVFQYPLEFKEDIAALYTQITGLS